MWNLFEQQLTKFNRNIFNTMIHYVDNELNNEEHKHQDGPKSIALIYDELNVLNKRKSENLKIEKIKKNQKKSDIIKMNVMHKKIKDEYGNIQEIFSNNCDTIENLKKHFYKTEFIEFKGLCLMLTMEKINSVSVDNLIKYDLLIGSQNFLTYASNVCNNISFINDFVYVFNRFKRKNKLDNNTLVNNIITNYPILMACESYNINNKITLRDHQMEIIDYIKNINDDDKHCIIYTPMIGLGKTSIAVMLAYMNKDMNKEIIFCCGLKSVIIQVAQALFNMKILFGVAEVLKIPYVYDGEEIYVKISNSYICPECSYNKLKKVNTKFYNGKNTFLITNDSIQTRQSRSIIICDMDACDRLLSGEGYINVTKTNNYINRRCEVNTIMNNRIAFIDEPTVGWDNVHSDHLRKSSNILKRMPNVTILSSATFPNIFHLPCFSDKNIKVITSKDITISCSVNSMDGKVYIPHVRVSNMISSDVIKNSPFLKRMYNHNILIIIANIAIKNNIIEVDHLEKNVNLSNLSHTFICNECIKLIELIMTSNISEAFEELMNESVYESLNKNQVNFREFIMSDRYTCGTNLISTDNPMNFIDEYFSEYLDECVINNGINIDRIIHEFIEDKEKYDEHVTKLRDGKKKKLNDDEGKNKMDIERKDCEDTENLIPKFNFPDSLQIGTKSFVAKFLKSMDTSNITYRQKIDLSRIDWGRLQNVNSKLLLLLCIGIGVYSDDTISMNDEYSYSNLLIDYINKGMIHTIVSDDTITFGSNYPITKVFICDDYTNHSIENIFQLMGRSGRVGKSWRAQIYISNNSKLQIDNYVNGIENEISERMNMEKMFLSI